MLSAVAQENTARLTGKVEDITGAAVHRADSERRSNLEVAPAGDCSSHAMLDYIRFLPTKDRFGNLGGSVRIDEGPMVANSPSVARARSAVPRRPMRMGSSCSSPVTWYSKDWNQFIFRSTSRPALRTIAIRGCARRSLLPFASEWGQAAVRGPRTPVPGPRSRRAKASRESRCATL